MVKQPALYNTNNIKNTTMKQFKMNNSTARIEGYIYTDSREYGTALLFVEYRQSYYVLTDDGWLGSNINDQIPDGWERTEDIEDIRKYFRIGGQFKVIPTALNQILSIVWGTICRIEDYIANDPDNCDWDLIDKYKKLPDICL